jgi:hypothetical protein
MPIARVLMLVCILALSSIPVTAAAQIDDDLEDAGVVSETEWESPQFGTSATWGGDWTVSDNTYTSPDEFKDGLALLTRTAYFGVTVIQSVGEDPASYQGRLVDLRSEDDEGFDIIDEDTTGDRTWLVSAAESDGAPYLTLVEIGYFDEDEDLLILVEINAWLDDAIDVYESAQEDIEVDNDEPFQVIDEDIIAEMVDIATGEAESSGDAPAAEVGNDEAIDNGLIDDETWQSPQFDTLATWDSDAWSPMPDSPSSDVPGRMDNLKLQDDQDNIFQVTAFVSRNESPSQYLDRLLVERAPIDTDGELEVLAEGTAGDRVYVIYITESANVTWYVLSEVGYLDEERDVLIKNEMLVRPSRAQEVFDAIQTGIEVDEAPPFLYEDDLPQG